MAHNTPRVQQGLLKARDECNIAVGTPDWYVWLEQNSAFGFACAGGTFTARKESRSGSQYWYAYRRRQGLLHSAYLGKSRDLTLARLSEVAIALATTSPAQKKSDNHARKAVSGRTPLEQDGLLSTKIVLPSVRPSLVERPRLIRRLDEGVMGKLTLVTGPAGAGKTTLLSNWLRQSSLQPAWISLDAGDNDDARFWSYVIAALQRLQAGIASQVLILLSSLQFGSMEAILTPFVNALATLPFDVALVLDDYHLIEAQSVHEALSFVLAHLPSQIHFVIASRSTPPFSLAQMRAQGHLCELDATDLHFTRQEAETFLCDSLRQPISAEHVSKLVDSTEGWITGLHLAVLALQDCPDPAIFIAQTGAHRYTLEYLASEVLARQPGPVQEFLLQTSILEGLNGALCDAITGQTGSNTLLYHLEQENLFLLPLDEARHWYRYHALFSQFLRERLRQEYPALLPELYQRASAWYEQAGLLAEAITYALQAEDFAHAADLIEHVAHATLMRHEIMPLASWLRALPDEVVRTRPRLCIAYAWVHIHIAGPDVVDAYLSSAECVLNDLVSPGISSHEQQVLRGEIAAIRARAAIYQDAIERSIALSQQALTLLPESETHLRGEVALSLGTSSLVRGDLSSAIPAFNEAISMSQAVGNLRTTMLAVRSLANLYVEQGRLHAAMQLYQETLAIATRISQEELPPLGFMYVGIGELLYEWNDLEDAARYLQKGIECGQRSGDVKIWLIGYIWLTHVRHAQGDIDTAWMLFQQAEALARQANFSRGIVWLEQIRIRLSMMQGDMAPVLRWATTCGIDPAGEPDFLHEYDYYLLAQMLILQDKPAPAIRILTRLLEMEERTGRNGYKITLLLYLALAYTAQAMPEKALDTLARSLTIAASEGYIRTYLDEGARVGVLLKNIRQTLLQKDLPPDACSRAYVDKLLKAFRVHGSASLADARQPLVEPLSQRELEVLRLLAGGLSNQEIADRLIIGLNTIKTHTRHIYEKLEVGSRTQAIARAKSLRILRDAQEK